jgi:hypothetical protein
MIKKTIVSLILAQMIILSLAMFFCQPVSGQEGAPTVNFAFTEQSNTADVGPSDTGEVQFNGVVSVDINEATKVIVNIFADDTWNSSVVKPKILEFTGNGEKQFNVSVWVPLGTSFTENGLLTILGNWTASPGNYSSSAHPIQGAVARIDINQFYNFNLTSSKDYLESSPGGQLVFTLTIHNLGNWMDTFSIEILNEEELNKKGFEVILTQSNIEISEKPGEEKIRIQVKTPMKSGEHEIKVQVKSDKGIMEGLAAQNYTFKVKVAKSSGASPIPTGLEFASVLLIALLIGWIIERRKFRKI